MLEKDEKASKLFDMNIPVTWALGVFATLALTFGSTFTQVKEMNNQLQKLEVKLDRQDSYFQNTFAKFSDTNSKIAVMEMRLTQCEKEIADIKRLIMKEEIK